MTVRINLRQGLDMDSNTNAISSPVAAEQAPPVAVLLDMMGRAIDDLGNEIDALTMKLGPVLSPAPSGDTTGPDKKQPIGYSELASWMESQLEWVHRLTRQVNVVKNNLEI